VLRLREEGEMEDKERGRATKQLSKWIDLYLKKKRDRKGN